MIFSAIVVASNLLSANMVNLPYLALSIPAGLLTYPLTFLLSDFVTEIFGAAKAKLMVYMALFMSLLTFGVIQFALLMPKNWIEDHETVHVFLTLSGLRIFASIVSYVSAQLIDIQIYAAIKQLTGPQFLWLRNNASTCISQIFDTLINDMIFLWWGLGMTIAEVAPIMIFSYAYKAFFSVASTPLLYFLVYLIRAIGPIQDRQEVS